MPRWRNGRRGGLKIRFSVREWGFESLPGHQFFSPEQKVGIVHALYQVEFVAPGSLFCSLIFYTEPGFIG